MDPFTLAIEGIGLFILLMFVVVPVQEFKQIFKSIRSRDAARAEPRDRGPRE